MFLFLFLFLFSGCARGKSIISFTSHERRRRTRTLWSCWCTHYTRVVRPGRRRRRGGGCRGQSDGAAQLDCDTQSEISAEESWNPLLSGQKRCCDSTIPFTCQESHTQSPSFLEREGFIDPCAFHTSPCPVPSFCASHASVGQQLINN